MRGVVAAAVQRWGRVDLLVNNAAMMTFDPISDLEEEDWDKVLAVNLKGPFLFSKYCLPHMSEGSAIVNVSSVHAAATMSGVVPYAIRVCPKLRDAADLLNEKRFLSLDLCYGRDVRACMYQYLTDNGMTRGEYDWFMQCAPRYKPFSIIGKDYYLTNEHMVSLDDGPITASGEIFGYYIITKQYYDRYHLPVMHTETNLADAERAPGWLEKEWLNMLRLKQDGVPIVGFTWYSLTDQVDWDTALREDNGNVNPLGLFDLDRKIRPVGKAYRELVKRWRDILPAESICLSAG